MPQHKALSGGWYDILIMPPRGRRVGMIDQADGSPYLLRLRLGRTWKGAGVVVGAT
jgi:hypothetical protein